MAAARTMALVAAALLLFLCALGAAVAERSSYVVYLGDHANSTQLGTHGADELAGVLGEIRREADTLINGAVSVFPNQGGQFDVPGDVPRDGPWSKARFRDFDTGDNTAPMSSRGSSTRASGLAILLLAVSTGIYFGDYGLVLGFLGVFVGSSLITVGIKMADVTMTFGTEVLIAFRHRNLAIAGLVMASFAIMTSAGEAGIALCFSMFVLLMLGVWLINIGIVGK
ncbi:hypothetical protein EJB05_51364, partial [Eragrostis curvula]